MTDECLWFSLLIDDVRSAIAQSLDPVSAVMLGWTCRAEQEGYRARKDIWTYGEHLTAYLAGRLGYLELFDYCMKVYEKEYFRQDACFAYILGGDERAYPWVKKYWDWDRNKDWIPVPWTKHMIASMSWPMFSLLQDELSEELKPGYLYSDFQHMLGNVQYFRDVRVMRDILKRINGVRFSPRAWHMTLIYGSPEIRDYFYNVQFPNLTRTENLTEEHIYPIVDGCIYSGNVDGILFLMKHYPVAMEKFFGSPSWGNASRKMGIQMTLGCFRSNPIFARNVIPMIEFLLSKGCLWPDNMFEDLIHVMCCSRTWDKQLLLALRDLGMPIILKDSFFKGQLYSRDNPYIQWVLKYVLPPGPSAPLTCS